MTQTDAAEMASNTEESPESEGSSEQTLETKGTGNEVLERPDNPLDSAPFFSRLTFHFALSMMRTGLERPLQETDLPNVSKEDTSQSNLELMSSLWAQEETCAAKNNRKPSLHRAILKHYMAKLWFVMPMHAIIMGCKIGQALALGKLIETFNDDDDQAEGEPRGYVWAGVLVGLGIIMLFTIHNLFFFTWRMGMKLRICAIASIYDKALRLSSVGGASSTTSGQLSNLASNDVERFIMASIFIAFLVSAPVEAILILIAGLNLIGPAFAAGYALLFIFVPLQFYLGAKIATFRSKIAAITDERITMVSQAVSGVRVMKMSGWEMQFQDRITKIREKELNEIQHSNRLKALNEAIFFFSNTTVCIVIFFVRVRTGGELTPRTVFTTFALINIIQFSMTKFFSFAVIGCSECYVSIRRLQEFLSKPEIVVETQKSISNKSSDIALSVSNLYCYWNAYTSDSLEDGGSEQDVSLSSHDSEISSSVSVVALKDLSIDLHMGELVALVGPVGSGKSALIQALAGELLPGSGTVTRRYKSLAYAAQEAWIMNGSVKDNITMGIPYNSQRYNEIIDACGLHTDFKQFRNGDATIVGDRGVQCSGGQRARIGLARALYRDADVILLDDPLSAVDAKVGRRIYYKAIQNLCVNKGKCVVLATHQHQFLGGENCILMKRGSILYHGTYDECVNASGGLLRQTLKTSHDEMQEEKAAVPESVAADGSLAIISKKKPTDESNDDDLKEMTDVGDVKMSTWLDYFSAMGGSFIGILLFLIFTITQGSIIVTMAAIGKWAEEPKSEQSSSFFAWLVGGLGIAVILLSSLRAIATFFYTIKASQHLHEKMTAAVLRAKIDFFDTNPLGRILNRFSADIGISDDILPMTFYDFFMTFFLVIGGVITAAAVLPFTLIAFPFLAVYFLHLRKIFITTSRELKRFEGLARSPIFSMMSESLSGIATIRANDSVHYFKSKFQQAHDAHSRAFFGFIMTSRWLGFRMDSIMFILLVVTSFSAVIFKEQGWFSIDASVLGLALTQLLQLAGVFQWMVRQSAEIVNNLVSVERVSGFCKLTAEPPLFIEEDKHAREWPQEGNIDVHDLKVRYRASLPAALSNVSFQIKSGQRVGVVGRTGSGKSTLVQAIFRLLNAEEGNISIDGRDITSVGLNKLRTEISCIPQVPVLFSGCSLRENLDPFSKYEDAAVWHALRDVQMEEAVQDTPGGLNAIVAEGGSNWSCGQRQLLCLARAILRKNKILVLDEPTANVDSRTDVLLQRAVTKSFPNSTVIAVAHRLDTIIDYDMILVFGHGELLEFGKPAELISRRGHFASMVEDTGEEMSKQLRKKVKG